MNIRLFIIFSIKNIFNFHFLVENGNEQKQRKILLIFTLCALKIIATLENIFTFIDVVVVVVADVVVVIPMKKKQN